MKYDADTIRASQTTLESLHFSAWMIAISLQVAFFISSVECVCVNVNGSRMFFFLVYTTYSLDYFAYFWAYVGCSFLSGKCLAVKVFLEVGNSLN